MDSESVRFAVASARVASPIIAAALLGLWLWRRHRRHAASISIGSILSCAIGAIVMSPAALFVGLVAGGYLGAGLGEASTGGSVGATAGLALGFIVVAVGLMVVGGLAGVALERVISGRLQRNGERGPGA